MKHSFYVCLAMVAVNGGWMNGSACADVVVVQGKTFDEDGSKVEIDQIDIYAADIKSGSVIPDSNTPDGRGGYTLQLQNPPGLFTVYGTSKIGLVLKLAQSGPLNPAFVKNKRVDLTFYPRHAYDRKYGKGTFKKHLEKHLKILPKGHRSRKYLQECMDAIR